MQFGRTFGQRIAGFHEVAVGHGDVLALGHQVFLGITDFGGHHQLALALGFAGVGHGTGDLGAPTACSWLADFEELGHAGKTTHDVLGLGSFAGLTGDDVTAWMASPSLTMMMEPTGRLYTADATLCGRCLTLPFSSADRDGRTVVGGTVFHDGQGCLTRHVVHLFLHGLAVHDVGEADDASSSDTKGSLKGSHSASTVPLVTS